jgi:hypothetical protein
MACPNWVDAVGTYGADPLGVADSTTAIRNAITAAGSGTTYLRAGTYKVLNSTASAILNLSSTGARLLGDGMSATFIEVTSTAQTCVVELSGINCILEGVSLITSVTQSSGDAVYLSSAAVGCTLRDINIGERVAPVGVFYNGIHDNGIETTIDNFLCNVCANAGIFVDASGGPVVVNGNIGSCRNGILLYGGGQYANLDIILSSEHGIVTYPGTGVDIFGLRFTDVDCDTCTNSGFAFITNGGTVADVQLNGCWGCTNSNYGVWISEGAGKVDSISINGGDFINNAQDGIKLDGCTNVGITNANIGQNGTSSNNTYDGIHVSAGTSHFRLTGNTCGGCGTLYIRGTAETQQYGILVEAGASDYYTITGNICAGNVTGGISNGGTGTHTGVGNNA